MIGIVIGIVIFALILLTILIILITRILILTIITITTATTTIIKTREEHHVVLEHVRGIHVSGRIQTLNSL